MVAEKVHDRMPVILPPRDYELWLAQQVQPKAKLLDCLKTYPAEEMKCWPVSSIVKNPKNEREDCFKREDASVS